MVLNAFVDSFLPQSERKCGTERVKLSIFTNLVQSSQWPAKRTHWDISTTGYSFSRPAKKDEMVKAISKAL